MLSSAEEIVTSARIEDFDHAAAETILQWALEKFSPRIALAC